MNNNAQIIPVAPRRDHLYVDEPAEFSRINQHSEQNRQRETERIESEIRERNRQRREARREWRHLMHNCYLMFLGIVATCCALASITAIRASYPALAIFPAVLALVSLWAGMVQKNG